MAKILLVEDDNNLREIYEARLAAEGYDIVSARDGEEALTVAMKEKPDLIISDVMMPKISGFDMLDILRTTEETKNAKVIMMTALSQAEDKERAEKLGADRYLVKSQVTLEDVAKVAGDVLAGKPAQEDAPAAPTSAEEESKEEPVVATPVATESPIPQPVAQTPAAEPTATPDPAPIPEPTPVPAEQQAQEAAPAAGIDAISSATPTTTDTAANENASTPAADPVIPVSEPTAQTPTTPPLDDQTSQPATDDPVVQSAQTEEQVIAQQIKDNLNIGQTTPEPAARLEPVAAPAPAPEPLASPDPAPAPKPTSTAPSRKKTIEPLNELNAPGPDLHAMAAKEEAAQQTNQPVPQPATNEVINPNQTPTQVPPAKEDPPQPGSSVDPNSIAL